MQIITINTDEDKGALALSLAVQPVISLIVKKSRAVGVLPASFAMAVAGCMAGMEGMTDEEWNRQCAYTLDAIRDARAEGGFRRMGGQKNG